MKKPIPFGKYLLLERINVGGMAEVFLGKAFGVEGFERLLAIKRILPTMVEDTEFITMFLDEARISVQLNHANVVQIYELGMHDESYYIAMEYVSGKDLRHLLEYYRKNRAVMPTPQAAFVASKICEGLEYAHRKKDARGQDLHIVHRDVSPQNILLSYEGEVKLIDFGIAKAANRAQKTQAGILKGKFGYMSPEQVRGLPIDHRSDIFAVGVILYEMLTGERLFVGESDFSTLEKVRNADVLPPRQFNSDIPAGLEKVVMKSLARDVQDRYQWCSDMQEDLMRFLLSGDTIYAPKHLGGFMREAFADDQEKEQDRLQKYAQVERPDLVQVSGVTASNGAAPQHQPEPEPEPEPEEAPPPPRRRPTQAAPRMEAVEAAPDPYNPVIPPPEPGELDEEPSADRTEIFQPAFEAPKAPQRKPARALGEDGEESTMTPVSPPKGRAPKGTVNMRPPEPEPEPEPEQDEFDEEDEDAENVVKTVIGLPAPRINGQRTSGRRPAVEEPEDGPATMPPEQAEEPEEPEAPEEEEQEDEEPVEDPNATVMKPPPSVPPRRAATSQRVPASRPATSQRVPVARPPTSQKVPAAKPVPRAPTKQASPVVRSAKKPSKLPLILASVGALVLVVIVAIAVVFKPGPASVLITVEGPQKAKILLDGKPVKAGVQLQVQPGKHLVKVDAEGFKAVQEEFTARPNATIPLAIAMESLEKAEPGESGEPGENGEPGEVASADPKDGKDPNDDPKDGKEPKADPKEGKEPVVDAKPDGKEPKGAEPKGTEPKDKPVEAKGAEPKPTEKPEEKKPVVATLKLESMPTGADVEVDGKKVGKTPKTLKGIDPAKTKSVTFILKGYRSDTKQVSWDGSATELSLYAALEKLPEAQPKTEPRPEPKKQEPKKTEPVAKAPAKEPAKPAAPKGVGKLVTISKPVAKVSVDGKDTGRWTPIPPAQPLELPAGDHVITYTAGDGRVAKRNVSVPANETVKVVGVEDFQ